MSEYWSLPFYDCKIFKIRNVTANEATEYIIKNKITLYGNKTDNSRYLVKIPKYLYYQDISICKDYLVLNTDCICVNKHPIILYNNLQIKTVALKNMLNKIGVNKND